VQEAEERSKAAAVKHESCLQQLSAEHAHTLELDSQIEDQHKVSCVAAYHNIRILIILIIIVAIIEMIIIMIIIITTTIITTLSSS